MKLIKSWSLALLSTVVLLCSVPQLAVAEQDALLQAPTTVNINTASVAELSQALKGVGQAKAEAIVAWREEFGGFQHVEELEEVKGIGPAIVEKNKAKISLN